MTINRLNLLTALNTVSPVIGAATTMEMLNCVQFTGERVVATDLDRFISVPFVTDFKGLVPAKKIIAFLKSMTSETVDISIADNHMVIKFGKARGRFAMIEGELPWAKMDDSQLAPFPFDSARFMDCYGISASYVSTDTTRMVLQGIFMSGADMVATDGRRLSQVTVGETGFGNDVVLMPSFISLVKSETITEYVIDSNYIAFKTATGVLLAGRMIDAVYPNYKQVIPTVDDTYIEVGFPDNINEYLKRAMLINASGIKLEVKDTECTISASNEEGADYTETIPVSASGEVSVVVNPAFMVLVFAVNNTLHISKELGPIVSSRADGKIVVMPMRVT
jgi:DNA polymerase III sliding clamp (beta) subunit (PCNA family)